MSGEPKCRYCERRHEARYLCDQAREILAAMHRKADSYNMPSVDFDEPIEGDAGTVLGFGQPGDALVAQLVIKSLVVDVLGVWRPAVILTGRRAGGADGGDGAVLPQWLHAGEDADMRRAAALFTERVEAAIAAATRAN